MHPAAQPKGPCGIIHMMSFCLAIACMLHGVARKDESQLAALPSSQGNEVHEVCCCDLICSAHATCCNPTYWAPTAVHHPVQMNKEKERNLKPAILLCDDHQDCFMPYREQRRFDLYLMKGACLAGRACHDGLHALQSEGGRSEGRQDAYASELHSSWRQCVRCLTGPAL